MSARVALVTGGTGGIGTAIVRRLADSGYRVATNYRNEDKARAWQAQLRADGYEVALAAGDVTDHAAAEAMVREIERQLGPVDILINNGAMWLERSDEDHRPEEVLAVVNAAVSGTFLLTQGLLPLLHGSSRPDIVPIGSISGLPGAAIQTTSVPFYAAKRAQAALAEGFGQMLAGTPVRSLIVHPHYLDDVEPGA
mgnify:CR=1 FL=1